MSAKVHAVMQDADDLDRVSGLTIKAQMPAFVKDPIAGPDVIPRCPDPVMVDQEVHARSQMTKIGAALHDAPATLRVSADFGQILVCCSG
jgi:hypothetical protein